MNNRGNYQYFICNETGDTKGTYIRKKDIALAKALAQKDYDRKIIACGEEWIKWIDKMIASMPKDDYKTLYSKSFRRAKIITPYEITDEEFAQNWEAETYISNPYEFGETEYFTDKGERVRSKSEVIIANTLYKMGIPYKYEKPLELGDGRTFYPDFTLLDKVKRKEIYLEHFGMMDDEEYSESAYEKILQYEKKGFFPGDRFIFTMESSRKPLDMMLLKDLLSNIFDEK